MKSLKRRLPSRDNKEKSSKENEKRRPNPPIINYKYEIYTDNQKGLYKFVEPQGGKYDNLSILMIIDKFNIGGTETYTLTLTRQLLKKGLHVCIAGKSGNLLNSFAALGCPVYQIDFTETNDPIHNDERIDQLKTIMNTENINIVHCHHTSSGRIAVKAAKKLRIPLVFTMHETNYDNHMDKFLQSVNAVICVSPVIMKEISNKKILSYLIPNGIDTIEYNYSPLQRILLRQHLNIPDEAQAVLYAGRLSRDKASICMDVIDSCAHLIETDFPDLHLLILGKGSRMQEIKDVVEKTNSKLGGQFIHLMGSSLNMNPYYSASDCVIGTGRVAIEAIACKCPTIAVGSKGCLGLVKPENYESAWETWFGDHDYVPAVTKELIENEIKQTLLLPPSLRSEWGWVGRNYIKNNFNIAHTTGSILHLYGELLNHSGLGRLVSEQ